MRRLKKSKYKSVVIKKKRYYFYKITWLDITGDSGHADLHTAEGFMPSEMVTHAYLLNKDRKNVRTFASYEGHTNLANAHFWKIVLHMNFEIFLRMSFGLPGPLQTALELKIELPTVNVQPDAATLTLDALNC